MAAARPIRLLLPDRALHPRSFHGQRAFSLLPSAFSLLPSITASTFSRRRDDAGGPILAVIAIGAIARFLLASTVGLGVDESYAVAVARQFSWSYFDHPPLHFWLAGAAARLAHSEMGEVVRFPFVLCFAGTTWCIYSIGRRLFGERAGLLGAVLVNVSAVFSLSTGGWVLPDGPLMLCMAAAAECVTRIVFGAKSKERKAKSLGPGEGAQMGGVAGDGARTGSWCLAGVLTGLAMLSKYHGVFVLAGTAAFLLTSPRHRHWLATPGPYLGALIAIACFTPVIAWNAQHHWASFAFQGARTLPPSDFPLPTSPFRLASLLSNIGGQAAWVLPWIFIPLAASAWRALRSGPADDARWFLLCLAAGPIVGFTLVSLRGDVGLPHWQAPGWLFVFPMLGVAAAERIAAGRAGTRRWLRWSVWGYVALIVVLTSHASTGWIARVTPAFVEAADPTADLVTWRKLRAALLEADFDPSKDFVAASSWIQAGKAAIGAGPGVPVLCLCADPHQFYYMNDDRAFIGRNAIIVHKVRAGDDIATRFAPYFERVEPITQFAVTRGPQDVMTVELLRATNFRAPYPTNQPR